MKLLKKPPRVFVNSRNFVGLQLFKRIQSVGPSLHISSNCNPCKSCCYDLQTASIRLPDIEYILCEMLFQLHFLLHIEVVGCHVLMFHQLIVYASASQTFLCCGPATSSAEADSL